MQWKWKEWEHSAIKMAWPCPVFMAVRHIAQVLLLLLSGDVGKRRPEEDGVGVVDPREERENSLAGEGEEEESRCSTSVGGT